MEEQWEEKSYEEKIGAMLSLQQQVLVEVAGHIKKAQHTWCLKRNLKDASRKEKLVWKWSAHPYTITCISECGNVYVKDIWGKAHKRSVPPNQLKPYKDANYISLDEDVEHSVMEKISVIKSFHHQQFPSSKVSVVKYETSVSPECKKPKIDLNMPVKNIFIEVLDKIKENHIQTAINESWPDEPSPEFQDFTTQMLIQMMLSWLLLVFYSSTPSWILSFKLCPKEKNFYWSFQAWFWHQSTISAVW